MKRFAWRVASLALFFVVFITVGCGGSVNTPLPGNPIDGNRDSSVTSDQGKTSGEPNGTFQQAIVAVFDEFDTAELHGTVSTMGDLDVYRLGPLSAGDRVVIDVRTSGAFLDAAVGLFDGEGRLVAENDDRGGTVVDRFLDPLIDFIVRHDSDSYFLVVTNSAFAGSGRFTGVYLVDIVAESGLAVPPPVGQILRLDFDGAVIDSPVLGTFVLPPFDAGNISPVYQGQTEVIKNRIREVFEQNFERFNITILTSDDPPPANPSIVSNLFIGGFDSKTFGIAEGVDLYNADFCDDAVIFADSFTPSVFTGVPTAVEVGDAIANVGSHEAGHLLGLNHTDDDLDIMDDRSAADAFLDNQEFMEAPLSSDIMSIGTQDGALLLAEIVGFRAGGAAKQRMDQWVDPRSARSAGDGVERQESASRIVVKREARRGVK